MRIPATRVCAAGRPLEFGRGKTLFLGIYAFLFVVHGSYHTTRRLFFGEIPSPSWRFRSSGHDEYIFRKLHPPRGVLTTTTTGAGCYLPSVRSNGPANDDVKSEEAQRKGQGQMTRNHWNHFVSIAMPRVYPRKERGTRGPRRPIHFLKTRNRHR